MAEPETPDLTDEEYVAMMADFVADRNAALLSMDLQTLLAFGARWGVDWHYSLATEHVFWASVHTARTGAIALPLDERLESKAWLEARGLRHLLGMDEIDPPKQE